MRDAILQACREGLDENAMPAQILFVSHEELPKGSSGKYLRTQMAKHLNATAVDVGALRVMENLELQQRQSSVDMPKKAGRAHQVRVRADIGIDGIRVIASIFVVMNHVGFYPNLGWEKLRGFNLSIPIFFILAAFQLSLSVVGDVKWSTFVGTRIGNLHSLYVVTQLIALPSLLVFDCAGDSTGSCDSQYYMKQTLTWFFSTLTGMFGVHNFSNPPSWFLTTIYQFMILFPFVDRWARHRTKLLQAVLLFVFVCLATGISAAIYFAKRPNPPVNKLRWSIIAFFPTLFSSMICAYFFIRSQREESTGAAAASQRKKAARRWAIITDIMSVVLLVLCVLVVTLSDCLWLPETTASAMRSDQPPSEVTLWSRMPPKAIFERRQGHGQLTSDSLVKVCDVSYEEFVTYLHDSPITPTMGRFPTQVGLYVGRLRMGTPIAMLWIYGLAQGHGLTARIMRLTPLVRLSSLTYHLYLLHVPIARFYWLATRPDSLSSRQFWYSSAPLYPFPIEWWEVIILIAICLILGAAIEHFLTPMIQPQTVRGGVWVCDKISSFFKPRTKRSVATASHEHVSSENCEPVSTEDLIKAKVQGVTGVAITRDTNLRELGLDSLGTSALLSTIRSATPLAEKLSVHDLSNLETVGELVDYLENSAVQHRSADEEEGFSDESEQTGPTKRSSSVFSATILREDGNW